MNTNNAGSAYYHRFTQPKQVQLWMTRYLPKDGPQSLGLIDGVMQFNVGERNSFSMPCSVNFEFSSQNEFTAAITIDENGPGLLAIVRVRVPTSEAQYLLPALNFFDAATKQSGYIDFYSEAVFEEQPTPYTGITKYELLLEKLTAN